MILVRIGDEEIRLDPEEWEIWVQNGWVPPLARVRMPGGEWMVAHELEDYRGLVRRSRETVPPRAVPPEAHLGKILFPRGSFSALEILVLVNLAVTAVLMVAWRNMYLLNLTKWASVWWHAVHDSGAFWWWIPTMFLHIGPSHLLSNMVGLVAGAGAVEFLLGRRWTFVVYLATGLGGAVVSYLGHGRPPLAVGASGAVLGLVGCAASFMLRRNRLFTYRQRWKTKRIYAPLVVLLVLPSVAYADYLGHTGGLVTGLLLGLVLPPHPRILELARGAAEEPASD